MSEKRIGPYTRLKNAARDYQVKVQHAARKVMWTYPAGKLGSNWTLTTLFTLYKVNPADCVVWEPDTIYPSTMTVLRPRRDGRYTLPEESSTR